ncbi:MAG: GAF domain-containing protein [Bacteroidales bacterium]
MKLQMRLKYKIQLLVIFIAAIIYLIAIGYISINARQTAYRDTKALIDSRVSKFALEIQDKMNQDMTVVRTLSLAFSNYDELEKDEWQSLIREMYEDVFPAYPNFYNLWDSWELSVIDTAWNEPYGRIVNQNFRDKGVFKTAQTQRSLDGDNEIYSNIKNTNAEMVLPLYFDVFTEGKSERKLMTSLLSPIQEENGEYMGAIAVDITMDRFQELIKDIKLENLDNSYAFLLSHKGKYAGHPDTSFLNTEATENPTDQENFNLYDQMKKGEPFSVVHKENEQEKRYVSYAPIEIGKTGTPWYLGISVPVSSIMDEADKNFIVSLIVGLLGLLILSLVIYTITRNITNPIEQVTQVLKRIANGEIDNKMKLSVKTGDEIEEMATALNTSIDGLNEKNIFADHLGDGDLDHSLELLSAKDELGKSLLEMRDSLKKAREEEEKRKEEEKRRSWANEGLNKFADILRQDNDDLQKLSDNIIKNLVYYLDATQGGIFLMDEDENGDKFLNLYSAFAYDSKKFLEKKIPLGDGLVGTCAIEEQSIYMTDIPQDYMEVTSGLGDANPDCLLIVPLKTEEEVLGVIEIASFNKFEQYEIDFVEKVGQNIASTISAVQVNVKTQELLEQSKQQSEEMSAQEEEMRQNMEELKATQEEAARQKAELESFINAFREANYMVEYNLDEEIVDINDNYLNLVGMSREQVIGTHHSYKMKFTKEQEKNYKKFWDDLKAGKIKKDTNTIEVDGKIYTMGETYTPIKDQDGKVVKIIKFAVELSEFNKKGSKK